MSQRDEDEIQKTGSYSNASRTEWSRLIVRTTRIGLTRLRECVKCMCGCFTVGNSGKVGLRWVYDGRRVNVQHGSPLPCTVITPAALVHLECSPECPLLLVKSDVSSYFFNLKSPG